MPLVILPSGCEHPRDPCLGCRLMVEDPPSPEQSCEALCRGGPWETRRGLFYKTAPGWGRIKQPPPTRPGELVAEEGEVSEDWARVGKGRGQGRSVDEGAGMLKGDRMSSAGGGRGRGRHICPAPSLRVQGSVWSLLPSQPWHSSSDGIKTRRLSWVFWHPEHPLGGRAD